jgi:hypothetical protein
MLLATPVWLLLAGGAALAQETPAAQPATPTRPALTPLKVQLVVSRYMGEKKISSLPYVLWVTANDRKITNLRMGVEVPLPSGGNLHYRNVGTNIDCSATSVEGAFNLSVTLSDSSIHLDRKQSGQSSPGVSDAPAFRTFTSNFSILLRDGQTAQYTSATDPVSGEVMRVDVTLNVLK